MPNQKMGGCKKKGRSGRKPAHQRYNLTNRREVNKARRIAKQARIEAKQKERKEKLIRKISLLGQKNNDLNLEISNVNEEISRLQTIRPQVEIEAKKVILKT